MAKAAEPARDAAWFQARQDARQEAVRLAALAGTAILDTPPEPEFDALVQQAAVRFGTPISLVSLVDADRQWFKAAIGLPAGHETPREQAFCDHVIRGAGVMVVPDAAADPRFAGTPLVTGDPGIRFYAGAPLTLPQGARVGTLCIIDRVPRDDFGPAEAAALDALARRVAALLARRHA